MARTGSCREGSEGRGTIDKVVWLSLLCGMLLWTMIVFGLYALPDWLAFLMSGALGIIIVRFALLPIPSED